MSNLINNIDKKEEEKIKKRKFDIEFNDLENDRLKLVEEKKELEEELTKSKDKIQKLETNNEHMFRLIFYKSHLEMVDFIKAFSTYEDLYKLCVYHSNYIYNDSDRKSKTAKLLFDRLSDLIYIRFLW